MKIWKGVLPAIIASLVLAVSCTPEAVEYKQSSQETVLRLEAPGNLQATAKDGFVYLSWNPVSGADQYAIYRAVPAQTGVTDVADTAFQKIGVVDAKATPYVYEGRAVTVGGGTTYLDYVNLDNPLVAGNYQYVVEAQRYNGTGINTDENDIRYADSFASSPTTVAIAAVPAKGSMLPAPANFTVTSYGYSTHLQWDMDPRVAYYKVLAVDYADADDLRTALAEIDPLARSIELRNVADGFVSVGGNTEITTHAINIDSGDTYGTGYYFAVIAFPRDAYFVGSSYAAVQEIPADTLGSPINLVATATHKSEIILEFSAVKDADSYEIWRSNTGYGNWVQLTVAADSLKPVTTDSTTVRYHDTYQLEAGKGTNRYYYYKVRATAGVAPTNQVSWFSNVAYGKITNLEGIPSVGTINDLVATDGTFANKIELTWTKLDGVESYMIYRSDENDGTYELISGAAPIAVASLEADDDTLFYVDSTILPGENATNRNYYYKVVGLDTNWGAGTLATPITVYSPFSNSDYGYVSPNTVVVEPAPTLAAPALVAANNQGGLNNLRIQWSAVNAVAGTQALQATGYEVYYSTTASGEFKLACTIVTSGTTTVTNATGSTCAIFPSAELDTGYAYGVTVSNAVFATGNRYYFRVKSVNTSANMVSDLSSAAANWLNGLDATTVASGEFALTNDIAVIDGTIENVRMAGLVNGADEYAFIVSSVANLSLVANQVYATVLTEAEVDALLDGTFDFSVTGLAGSTTYYYGIRAASTVIGENSFSVSRNFTTPAIAP